MTVLTNDAGGLMRIGLLQCASCGVYAKDVTQQECDKNPRCSGCRPRQADALLKPNTIDEVPSETP